MLQVMGFRAIARGTRECSRDACSDQEFTDRNSTIGLYYLPCPLRADPEFSRQITQRFSGSMAYPNEYIALLFGVTSLQGRVEALNEAANGF